MTTQRKQFEQWYATHAFNYERDPIGSRDCGLQWAAWQAGQEMALDEAEKVVLADCVKTVTTEYQRQYNMTLQKTAETIRALAGKTR